MTQSILESLFSELKERSIEERKLRIDALSKSDPVLYNELSSLLEAADQAKGFLSLSPLSPVPNNDVLSLVSQEFTPYTPVRQLGEGGMGVVLEAVRSDGNFDKTVAIKVLRQFPQGQSHYSRFVTERQILARLEHPNIARLIDGGETQNGLPYLVMEYVDGQNIKDYCLNHVLSVENILSLFKQVCDAVEYAHHNQVVHRDIKPSNILVDLCGRPKLLDFGIAKLLAGNSFDAPVTTATGFLMTPEYAAPEQLTGSKIGKVSDVYALGIVLYELLTGDLPFELSDCNFLEKIYRVANCKIVPPSKSALTSACSRLNGEIDSLVFKAIDKDQRRRYQSAGEFAAAIQNTLDKRIASATSPVAMRFPFYARMTAMLAVIFGAATLLSLAVFSDIFAKERELPSRQEVAKSVKQDRRQFSEKSNSIMNSAIVPKAIKSEKPANSQISREEEVSALARQFSRHPNAKRMQLQLAKSEYFNSFTQAASNNVNAAIESAQRCVDTLEKRRFDKRIWWKNRFRCAMLKVHWYNVAGQVTQAESLLDETLNKVRQSKVEDWVPMFRSCEESAQILQLLGKPKDALRKQLVCVDLIENASGPIPKRIQHLAYVYHTLGDRYSRLGKKNEMKVSYRKALSLWENELSLNPGDANVALNLSDVLLRLADSSLAESAGHSVVSNAQRSQACEMLNTANELANKANVMERRGILRQYAIPNIQAVNKRLNTICVK